MGFAFNWAGKNAKERKKEILGIYDSPQKQWGIGVDTFAAGADGVMIHQNGINP